MNFADTRPRQLRYLVYLIVTKDEQSSDTLPYIGLENIEPHTGKLAEHTISSLSSIASTAREPRLGTRFLRGDVLFGKLRPYLAKAWLAEFEGVCTTEALVLRPHTIEPRYLRFYLLSPHVLDAIDASTFGSKMPRADWQFIGNLHVPSLTIGQQREVADYLDSETAEITRLIGSKKRSIELLRERRSSLISAVMTGQIDLRSTP